MNGDIPWRAVHSLSPDCHRELRRRAIFECCKWDPQVEDVDTLAPVAVVLQQSAWHDLAALAEALAEETVMLEEALARRPDLHRDLALSLPIRNALAQALKDRHARNGEESCPSVRVMRFDFHPTANGWRVSEVNSDVPGGYNEAAGWSALVAEHVPEGTLAADPARLLVQRIRDRLPPGGTVAMVHATAYTDDRQVMIYLARGLQREGYHAVLVGPDHIRWQEGRAFIQTDWWTGPADFVFRFYPAEWLPNLGRGVEWRHFFGATRTPLCNRATALLTQSKRWPLVMDDLGIKAPTWQRLLPETRDPRDVDPGLDSDWVLKPALGRVGELVGIAGVTAARDWRAIRRGVRWGARHWVAQKRFIPLSVRVDGQPWHICLGVYVIDGQAAGIYGRVAARPLIDHAARDAAVLVERSSHVVDASAKSKSHESVGTI
ncbi:MAG TPA: glutathionylspermidine synthase family protein [Candidatus Paceibacterota bacterium]|nr:glutathionylspermidine synthase family protein [Verrucomicrobiota bacterium]HRZ44646.1 glutathionylspermidine synthase family protein [Candidatus Paceibacterota bacterium]